MAKLKIKNFSGMNKEEREKKLGELKFELIKSKVNPSQAGGTKTKEIKKLIARILSIKK